MENEKKVNNINDEELTKISGGVIRPGEDGKVLEKIRKHGSYKDKSDFGTHPSYAYVKDIIYPSSNEVEIVFDRYIYAYEINEYMLIGPNDHAPAWIFGNRYDIDNEIPNIK